MSDNQAPIDLKKEVAADQAEKEKAVSATSAINILDGLKRALIEGSFPVRFASVVLQSFGLLDFLRNEFVKVLPAEEQEKWLPVKPEVSAGEKPNV